MLACVTCNSIKGSAALTLAHYYWPDEHNTFLLFDFHPLGVITVKPHLSGTVNRSIANATMALTGLDRFGSTASAADRRWVKRAEAYSKAQTIFDYYVSKGRPSDAIILITNQATSSGFWSVWMKVFETEHAVVAALKSTFLNTYLECDSKGINRV